MNLDGWSLHPQLERDTILLGDMALSRVLIIKDANYPWLLLVPRRPDIVEIIDLDEVEQAADRWWKSAASAASSKDGDAMRQAEHCRARQCGAAIACPPHRPPQDRRRLAKAGLGAQRSRSPHDAAALDRFMNAMSKTALYGFLN